MLGTPDYLAPEQAKDARNADIRADIYSLGCVLYHCLTGQPPFPETNIMAQMLKHATENPASLASFVAEVPPGLQALLDRMLAKSPTDRFATPAEAAEALAPFLGSGGTSPKAAALVPEFKAWLETESQMEMPKNLPPAPVKPGTERAVPLKPGTAPSPALVTKPGTAPAPAPASATKPGTAPSPALATSAKPGTAPMPALGANAKPARPTPTRSPIPLRPEFEDEVNVELVPEPLPGPVAMPLSTRTEVQIVKVKDERRLMEFDRRDWIMLAASGSVLVAVGVGYGLASRSQEAGRITAGRWLTDSDGAPHDTPCRHYAPVARSR